MSFSGKKQSQLILIFILFASLNFCYTQIIPSAFRSSDIEIVPDIAVINSTSITDFICINRQSNDLPLEVNITKQISSDQIKISTNILNKTTIHIQLQSKNYVGIFHLLCFVNGEQSKGTRADIIVKAAPGVLQLAEKCRVYDRQYIKCIIRAPIIARAIQNDYPAKFEFNEISYSSDSVAYISRVEFLKNESTNESLVFKWKPTIDGEFPNGVRMYMNAILPHFENSTYYFDMTPVFRIKPKFILQAISSREIQINLTPLSPPAFCEKSILPKLTSNINQTWTVIESDRNTIVPNNLLSDSVYRVCIKCRQVFTDPDGTEECQEMKTLSKFSSIFNQKVFLIAMFTLISILILTLVLVIYFWKRQKHRGYNQVKNTPGSNQNGTYGNHYEPGPALDTTSETSTNHNIEVHTPLSMDSRSYQEDSVADKDGNYLPIAPILEIIEQCSPAKILSPSGN